MRLYACCIVGAFGLARG